MAVDSAEAPYNFDKDSQKDGDLGNSDISRATSTLRIEEGGGQIRTAKSEIAAHRELSNVSSHRNPLEGSKSTPAVNNSKRLSRLISKTRSLGERSVFNAPPPRPINQTNIPFGVNRWVVLCIYCFYLLLTGVMWYNWPPIQEMLTEDGAYSWLCDNGEVGCDEQKAALAFIVTIAVSGQFMLIFVGGVILDTCGPRISSLVGFSFVAAGYVLFGLSSESLPLYIPGAILSTAGSDPVFLSCANVANLFPGFGGTIIGIIVTFRSLAFAYPLIIKVMRGSMEITFQSSLVVLGALVLIVGISAFIFVPRTPYLSDEELELMGLLEFQEQVRNLEDPSFSSLDPVKGGCSVNSSLDVTLPYTTSGHDEKSFHSSFSEREITPGNLSRPPPREFLNFIFSPFFLIFFPHYVMTFTRQQVFFNLSPELFSDTSDILALLNSFSAFLCPVMGYLADYYGALWLLHFMNFCGALLFLILLYPVVTVQYIAIGVQYPLVIFWSTHLFLYLHMMFPQRHIGKLLGLVAFVAGVVGLCAQPLYKWGLNMGTFWPLLVLFFGLSLLSEGLLIYLEIQYRRVNCRELSSNGLDNDDGN